MIIPIAITPICYKPIASAGASAMGHSGYDSEHNAIALFVDIVLLVICFVKTVASHCSVNTHKTLLTNNHLG